MQKCKSADKYKAIHPPKCDSGRGCDECRRKWEAKNQAKARRRAAGW